MTEIVHLDKKEQPPAGAKFLLIDVSSRRRNETGEDGPEGLTLKITPSSYEGILADCLEKAKAAGMPVIYVRGAAKG